MAKIINGATKRGQELLARARRYEGYYLDDVYGRFSSAKARAWRDCLAWCEADNGSNFHIISHNDQNFSVAWEYTNKETVELMTRIETSTHTYIIDGTRVHREEN